MSIYQTLTIMLFVAALFSYINERFLRLQATVGLMVLALVLSITVVVLKTLGVDVGYAETVALMGEIDFAEVLMKGMLCILLFAGALHVSIAELSHLRWTILTLAIVGTALATFIIASLVWGALKLIGIEIPFLYALIFGAIISPTDPIAALAILSKAGLPDRLQTLINGESLFNDGVGVVIFTVLTAIAFHGQEPSLAGVGGLFVQEVLGGVILGLISGWLGCKMLAGVKEDGTRVLITLAMVTSTYALGTAIHVSGPIAFVVLGLYVGNNALPDPGDKASRAQLGVFWHYLDEIFNGILFVLLGLQIIVIEWDLLGHGTILVAIACVLVGRWLSVFIAISVLNVHHHMDTNRMNLVKLLTWAGLRGGLAIALVLSIPSSPYRELLVIMTFGYVAFSVIVQGLSVGKLFTPKQMKAMSDSQ